MRGSLRRRFAYLPVSGGAGLIGTKILLTELKHAFHGARLHILFTSGLDGHSTLRDVSDSSLSVNAYAVPCICGTWAESLKKASVARRSATHKSVILQSFRN